MGPGTRGLKSIASSKNNVVNRSVYCQAIVKIFVLINVKTNRKPHIGNSSIFNNSDRIET